MSSSKRSFSVVWRDIRRSIAPIALPNARELYDAAYAERTDRFASSRHWREETRSLLDSMGAPESGATLDYGCNTGRSIELMRELGYENIVGVDINSSALEVARERFPETTFDSLDAFEVRDNDGRFSRILCNHVIGHVDDREKLLKFFRRISNASGKLAIATPNLHFKRAMLLANVFNGYSPDPTVLCYFSERSLRCLIESCGWRVACSRVVGGDRLFQRGVGAGVFSERILLVAEAAP